MHDSCLSLICGACMGPYWALHLRVRWLMSERGRPKFRLKPTTLPLINCCSRGLQVDGDAVDPHGAIQHLAIGRSQGHIMMPWPVDPHGPTRVSQGHCRMPIFTNIHYRTDQIKVHCTLRSNPIIKWHTIHIHTTGPIQSISSQ
jgi:hypothetical protein